MTTAPQSTSAPVRLGRFGAAALALAITAAVAACSSTPSVAASAEAEIVKELTETIGLGEITPSCTEPAELKAGETFTCTATAEDGQVVNLAGTMLDDREFNVVTTNLLTAEDIIGIREDAAAQFKEQTGVALTAGSIECPSDVVVLDDTGDFECEITDTTSGIVYELLISTGGLEPGVGAIDLNYEIGDEIG